MVYFDNSAATPCCDTAIRRVAEALNVTYANPSSVHGAGLAAERLLDEARAAVAGALSVPADCIYFTASGTESNNLALLGAMKSRRGGRIVTSLTEHDSVLAPIKALEQSGFEVIRLSPDENGVVSAGLVAGAVTKDTVLVSLMAANNETGAIQSLAGIRRALNAAGTDAVIHCDAVGALGKLDMKPYSAEADLISVSGHKIYGPKGAGALYVKKGVRVKPLVHGGGQEGGLWAGTQPLPAITGMAGALAELDIQSDRAHAARLKERLEQGLESLGGQVNARTGFPFILSFSLPGYKSETVINYLSGRDIHISAGSACSKGKQSHVLVAQGLPKERTDSALRASFGRQNTEQEIDMLLSALSDAKAHIQKIR